jgi:hypothetical protein
MNGNFKLFIELFILNGVTQGMGFWGGLSPFEIICMSVVLVYTVIKIYQSIHGKVRNKVKRKS